MGYFSKKLSDFRHRVGSIFSYSATDASVNNNQWLDSDDSEQYRRLPPCILVAGRELSRDVQTLQQKSKTNGTSLESKTAIRHHLPGRKGPATARLLENQGKLDTPYLFFLMDGFNCDC
ncbi:hypothetical protein BKA69DRAFT_860208 [Paraphysoderma sedebokerense]|nr:hypothetical protein BKA69DRAFT_860208 [Paraphysoderma sedebokerense]